MTQELQIDFEVLTPLFLGGAAPKRPELRPPSFKGLLRFWYRAIDPDYRTWELPVFGGAGREAGQSAVLLSIDSQTPKRLTWNDFDADRFSRGTGTKRINGLVYLGFPFQLPGADREAIAPDHRFAVRCLLPRVEAPDTDFAVRLRRSVAAAWWMLAHFGGVGSRSRRGFGSLAMQRWRPRRGEWPELVALPLVAEAGSAADARERLGKGLETIRTWFQGAWSRNDASPEHPHLGPAFRWWLEEKGAPRAKWAVAVAAMGERMQRSRVRSEPDYASVKDHLLAETRQGGSRLRSAPERATFGLPLAFRYSTIRDRTATFAPYDERNESTFERHGSLLLLRLLAIGADLHPLYVRMDGAVPGINPPAALYRAGRPLYPPPANAMDAFFDTLSREKG